MTQDFENGSNNLLDSSYELSEKVIEFLIFISDIRTKLLECPKGSYAPGYIPLPPSQETYWHNIEKLENKILELIPVLPEELKSIVSIELSHFRHTKEKECFYVQNFTLNYRDKKAAQKQYNKLSKLMVDANKHVFRDLAFLFNIVDKLTNDSNQ